MEVTFLPLSSKPAAYRPATVKPTHCLQAGCDTSAHPLCANCGASRQATAARGSSTFMYLVFTRIPGKSYRRQLWSLLLCLCDVSRALINSLISVSIVQKTTTTNSSQPGHCLPTWMCPDLQRRQLQPDGQLWSLLCLCDVSRALINSLMCRLYRKPRLPTPPSPATVS